MSDTLALAARAQPALMLDFATLTRRLRRGAHRTHERRIQQSC